MPNYDLAQNLLECSQVQSITIIHIPISDRVQYFSFSLSIFLFFYLFFSFLVQLCPVPTVVLASLLSDET